MVIQGDGGQDHRPSGGEGREVGFIHSLSLGT